jgi:hypothetical protein
MLLSDVAPSPESSGMLAVLPSRPLRSLAKALVFWLAGMVIGIVVFSVPQLRTASPIPYVSANPFISLPILLLWPVLARRFAWKHVSSVGDPTAEGLRLGLMFLAVNAVLDRVVVFGLMEAGADFYSYLGLWLAYLLLLLVPWYVGRGVGRQRAGARS